MSIIYNIGSLILGLISWGIPIVILLFKRKNQARTNFVWYSMSACLLAVLMQVFEIRNRISIGDLSAIMDTIQIVSRMSLIFVIVTIALKIGRAHF